MPVGDILASGLRPLTPQQIADFALQEDRERRRALARGDAGQAAEHDSELDKLAAAMRRAY